MAIQKVSDLPILRGYDYEKVKSSLIEISYKISSDEAGDGVSRYQSMAVTVDELVNYVLGSQTDKDIVDLQLSGNVFLNRNTDDSVAQDYSVIAKTGSADITALNKYELSSPDVRFNCGSFAVNTLGKPAVQVSDSDIHVGINAVFTGQVQVPTVNSSSPDAAAVNLGYLRKAIPVIENPFILFETRYLDYSLDSKHWINTTTAGWLWGSDYPDAYNHLKNDWANSTDITVTYTGSGISIPAKKAKDGHIMCAPNDNVDALFNKTGVAWIYVVDPDRSRFRLPRNSNYIRGCAASVDIGQYTPPTLPPHSHDIVYNCAKCACSDPGGIKNSPHNEITRTMSTTGTKYTGLVQTGSTVLPPAAQMYLYMYCS